MSGFTWLKRSSASTPSPATSTWKPSRDSPICSASTKSRLVLDHQHRGLAHAILLTFRWAVVMDVSSTLIGSRSTNVLPSPSTEVTDTSPPWLLATWRTIARPRPVPPVVRLRARLTR